MKLTEWLTIHVRHKDIIKKNLKEVKEDGEKIEFIYKDRTVKGLAKDRLELPATDEECIIATLNSQANVKFLIDNWEKFAKMENLTLIFVHLETNERWVIRPHIHHRIIDGKVEQGLLTLAQGVPFSD